MKRDKKGRFVKGYSYSPETQFQKEQIPWNKGKTYKTKPLSEKTKEKIGKANKAKMKKLWQDKKYRVKMSMAHMGKMMGGLHPSWKGNRVGYSALHDWVRGQLGKPKRCCNCGGNHKLHWANKSGKYKRKISDWIQLCYSCHREYDSNSQRWGAVAKRFPEFVERRKKWRNVL